MFEEFFDKCFEEALNLKERFKLIEDKNWDDLTIMNEFMVQMGHYAMLVSGQEIAKEKGRNIHSIEDEICDILLQCCAFCKFREISKEDIVLEYTKLRKKYNEFEDKESIERYVKFNDMQFTHEKDAIMNIMSLAGQIIEAILEEKKYRFYKPRDEFSSHQEFIIDKISKIFSIIFSIVEYKNIDIIEDFNEMCKDANNFIDKKLCEYRYPIVDLHASWIVLNPIQGCPNSCRYCFLNGVNLTKTKPKILATPQETIQKLLESKFYNKDIPVCIETESDGFATSESIRYMEQLLDKIDESNIFNLIVFITKCEIPASFISKIKELERKGHKFLFFLSYSGLDNDIEIGINKENIKRNFIELYNANLPIIHYWRPFLPQNSSKERIREVYNFVKKYAKCSVAIGLKVKENYKSKLDFWRELENTRETTCAESIWTKNAYDYIWGENSVIDTDYPIFKTTSCAIAYATKESEQEACFNSNVCINDNRCPEEQRILCREFYKRLKPVNSKYVEDILKKLKLVNDKSVYEINVNSKLRIIEIRGIQLNTKEFSLLTLLTKYRIKAARSNSDDYWNSFINDAKQIII